MLKVLINTTDRYKGERILINSECQDEELPKRRLSDKAAKDRPVADVVVGDFVAPELGRQL